MVFVQFCKILDCVHNQELSDDVTVAGAATSAAAWIIVDFSRFGEVKPAVIVWLAMASVADVVITCVLTWYLHSHRTGFPRTDDVITRIIRCA
ncbi:hypothetical protein FRC12_021772 [Ceratobasidium sp. 428]|nr:hypothetical protein FRC12_021772 [Ceratobasidium sp. 428]